MVAVHGTGSSGNDRFLVRFDVGALSHAELVHAIVLYGTEVAPVLGTALV